MWLRASSHKKYKTIHTKDEVIMRVEILVKKIRIEKGYTIDKVAQLAKMSKGHLSRIERGETEPTISTLARLAMALKADVNDLYKIHY